MRDNDDKNGKVKRHGLRSASFRVNFSGLIKTVIETPYVHLLAELPPSHGSIDPLQR